jgi:hypothetical protein
MASLSIEEGGSTSLSSLGAATSTSNSLQTASPTVTVLPDKVRLKHTVLYSVSDPYPDP